MFNSLKKAILGEQISELDREKAEKQQLVNRHLMALQEQEAYEATVKEVAVRRAKKNASANERRTYQLRTVGTGSKRTHTRRERRLSTCGKSPAATKVSTLNPEAPEFLPAYEEIFPVPKYTRLERREKREQATRPKSDTRGKGARNRRSIARKTVRRVAKVEARLMKTKKEVDTSILVKRSRTSRLVAGLKKELAVANRTLGGDLPPRVRAKRLLQQQQAEQETLRYLSQRNEGLTYEATSLGQRMTTINPRQLRPARTTSFTKRVNPALNKKQTHYECKVKKSQDPSPLLKSGTTEAEEVFNSAVRSVMEKPMEKIGRRKDDFGRPLEHNKFHSVPRSSDEWPYRYICTRVVGQRVVSLVVEAKQPQTSFACPTGRIRYTSGTARSRSEIAVRTGDLAIGTFNSLGLYPSILEDDENDLHSLAPGFF
jgi:hypothetical protein